MSITYVIEVILLWDNWDDLYYSICRFYTSCQFKRCRSAKIQPEGSLTIVLILTLLVLPIAWR